MFPFQFNREDVAIIIEIRGPLAAKICDSNRLNSYIEHLDSGYRISTPESREATPIVTADETVGYLSLPVIPYPVGGYSFGRSRKSDVVLPHAGRQGVSNTHFRIHVSQDRTWMLRNESANKTVVNNCLVLGSEALHPEEPNIIRIQDITLFIHIINGWIAPESCVPGMPPILPRSGSSQSSNFQPLAIPEFIPGADSKYHILRQTPIAAKGSHYAAINIPTGRRCVAMICNKAAEEERWRMRYDFMLAKSSHNDSIVRYIDSALNVSSFMIVANHIDGWTLEQYSSESRLRDSDLLHLYRQGINSLCYFERNGIEHRDIKLGNIIITIDPLKVYIAGFSECADAKSFKGSKNDLADFSRAYRSVALEALDESASGPPVGKMRGDPEIASLVNQALDNTSENCLSALEVSNYIQSLVGDNMRRPFDFFKITKSWTLKIFRDKNSIFVEVPTLLDRLLARRREISLFPSQSPLEVDASKYLRDQQTFDGIKYCTAHRALKFCRAYGLKDFRIIIEDELARKRFSRDDSRKLVELTTKTKLRIGYHLPTMMINFTHIAEAIGWRPAYLKNIKKPKILQEVEDETWKGIYIDSHTCTGFLASGKYNIAYPMHMLKPVPNDMLASQFVRNDPEKFILLITGRLNPNIVLVRRADCFVHWSPYANKDANFISPEEAYLKCDLEALPFLKESIEVTLRKDRGLDWSSWGPSLPEPIEDGGSDTSVNTIYSDDDDGYFRFRS